MGKEETPVQWLISQLTQERPNMINNRYLILNKSLAGRRLDMIFKQALSMENTPTNTEKLLEEVREMKADAEIEDWINKKFNIDCGLDSDEECNLDWGYIIDGYFDFAKWYKKQIINKLNEQKTK